MAPASQTPALLFIGTKLWTKLLKIVQIKQKSAWEETHLPDRSADLPTLPTATPTSSLPFPRFPQLHFNRTWKWTRRIFSPSFSEDSWGKKELKCLEKNMELSISVEKKYTFIYKFSGKKFQKNFKEIYYFCYFATQSKWDDKELKATPHKHITK